MHIKNKKLFFIINAFIFIFFGKKDYNVDLQANVLSSLSLFSFSLIIIIIIINIFFYCYGKKNIYIYEICFTIEFLHSNNIMR